MLALPPQDDPQSVYNAWQPAAQRQENVQPELQSEADLKKDAERRQKESEQYADNIQEKSPDVLVGTQRTRS